MLASSEPCAPADYVPLLVGGGDRLVTASARNLVRAQPIPEIETGFLPLVLLFERVFETRGR